jgi:holo-[acyl-carrier protein] synthase
MIIGTGVDIIEIARIARLVRRQPFPAKIYTQDEADACRAEGLSALRMDSRLAGLFAAKEAVMKALGTGWTRGAAFSEISISHTEAGQPQANLTGTTKAIAEKIGVEKIFLSISHTRDHAVAVVVLEGTRKKSSDL